MLVSTCREPTRSTLGTPDSSGLDPSEPVPATEPGLALHIEAKTTIRHSRPRPMCCDRWATIINALSAFNVRYTEALQARTHPSQRVARDPGPLTRSPVSHARVVMNLSSHHARGVARPISIPLECNVFVVAIPRIVSSIAVAIGAHAINFDRSTVIDRALPIATDIAGRTNLVH